VAIAPQMFFFVVAEHRQPVHGIGGEVPDHLEARWSAVYQIADRDQQVRGTELDEATKRLELVEAPVDIADDEEPTHDGRSVAHAVREPTLLSPRLNSAEVNPMRSALPIAIASALIAGSACQPSRREPATHHETRSFPAAAGKVVSCSLRSLDLDVRVQAGETIEVAVDLGVSSSARGAAERWLRSHTPTFRDGPSRLEINLPRRRSGTVLFGYLRTHGRVTLTLPPQSQLEVETSSGDITIGGSQPLAGPVKLRTASGDVEARGGVADLVVRTASGDVEIRDRALASLEFRSASGDVRVRDGCGNVIAETSSGKVRLARLVGTLAATTSSGDVVASWTEPPTRVVVATSSGDVNLELPAGVSLRGDVQTHSGGIHTSFEGRSGKRGRWLVWEGPAEACSVKISTSSGDVRLRRAGRPLPSGSGATPIPTEATTASPPLEI